MIAGLQIARPTYADLPAADKVFTASIRDAFEKEGLGNLQAEIGAEIRQKQRLLRRALQPGADVHFLVAILQGRVVGTASAGPCNADIGQCTDQRLQDVIELGSLYVLPEYQGQGVGSALIAAMLRQLQQSGIEQFCLDCGLRRAQQIWLHKFGAPYAVARDYWGPGSDHLVWLCRVAEFLPN